MTGSGVVIGILVYVSGIPWHGAASAAFSSGDDCATDVPDEW